MVEVVSSIYGLEALERRGEELEAFADAQRAANTAIKRDGTQPLVDELRQARSDRRRMKLGTINTLILLAHIDRLEAELAGDPMVKP